MYEREECFEISYRVGASLYRLDVVPEFDHENMENVYIISFNDAEIGVLKKTEALSWDWIRGGIEGTFTDGHVNQANVANEIGYLIEKHFY